MVDHKTSDNHDTCDVCGRSGLKVQRAADDGKLWCMDCAVNDWERRAETDRVKTESDHGY